MVKKLGTLVNKESEFIHSPFNGEKILGREAIAVTVKLSDGKWQEVKLHSYSPFGLEFVNNGFNLKKGDPIGVRTKLAGDENEFNGLVVNSVYEDGDTKLAGVRTFIKDKMSPADYTGQERRAHRRWSCSEDFLPTGTAPNPVRYNDYILFRVEDISKGGLKLITSMRNKFVGIGQRLECTLSLPYAGTVRADVKVKHMNTAFYRNKEFMIVGVEFIETDPILLRSLGEYLLSFAKDITVKSLNSEGFGLKNISKWLDFSYVKTEAEYKEVLSLRYNAYKSVGKVQEHMTTEDMADEFDPKSNILIAKYNGKIVGSIRIYSPNKNEKMEITKYVNYPENLPDISEVVEVSRLCVDQSFRSANITYELIANTIFATIKANRRYIFTSSVRHLLDFYKKCGTKPIGVSYKNEALNSSNHEIILLDTQDVLLGKSVSIRYWNIIYRDLLDYMIQKKMITITPLELLRIYLIKIVGYFLSGLRK